jgi:hypothetical protein
MTRVLVVVQVFDERPDDWEERVEEDRTQPDE